MSSIITGGRGPIPTPTSATETIGVGRQPSKPDRGSSKVQEQPPAPSATPPETCIDELYASELRGKVEASLDLTMTSIVNHFRRSKRVDLRDGEARGHLIGGLKKLFSTIRSERDSLTSGSFLAVLPYVFNPTTLAKGDYEDLQAFLRDLGGELNQMEVENS